MDPACSLHTNPARFSASMDSHLRVETHPVMRVLFAYFAARSKQVGAQRTALRDPRVRFLWGSPQLQSTVLWCFPSFPVLIFWRWINRKWTRQQHWQRTSALARLACFHFGHRSSPVCVAATCPRCFLWQSCWPERAAVQWREQASWVKEEPGGDPSGGTKKCWQWRQLFVSVQLNFSWCHWKENTFINYGTVTNTTNFCVQCTVNNVDCCILTMKSYLLEPFLYLCVLTMGCSYQLF